MHALCCPVINRNRIMKSQLALVVLLFGTACQGKSTIRFSKLLIEFLLEQPSPSRSLSSPINTSCRVVSYSLTLRSTNHSRPTTMRWRTRVASTITAISSKPFRGPINLNPTRLPTWSILRANRVRCASTWADRSWRRPRSLQHCPI